MNELMFLYHYNFLVKQVFSDMDFLGWYTTGEMPTPADVNIHKQICEINECPILLKLNPSARNGDVSIHHNYYTVIHQLNCCEDYHCLIIFVLNLITHIKYTN